MGRCEGVRVWLWPLLLCTALICMFAPALAFADAEDASGLTIRAAGISDGTDVETDEIDVLPEPSVTPPVIPSVNSKHKVGGSTYQITSNENKTVKFIKSVSASNVTVPKTVRIEGITYRVSAIAKNAFSSVKKKVKTITVGKNVRVIGKNAFKGCVKLTKVKGGAKVTTIGAMACAGCKNMKAFAPFSSKSLTKVGKRAFTGAKKLKTLTVKSKLLKGKSVKNSLSGSSVKTVKVKVGSKKANKKYVAKYTKVFAKKFSGKKVTVK